MEPTNRVLLACQRAGCELARVFRDGVGRDDLAYEVHCPTHDHKVRLLAELAEIDAADPWIRRRAMQIATDYPRDRLGQLLAIHRYVRDGVLFVDEPVETFAEARLTLVWQLGDCDCMALALYALLRAAGFTVRMAPLGSPPQHVAPQVLWAGRWEWLEPTLQADPGEHPVEARRRLGADDRPDIPDDYWG